MMSFYRINVIIPNIIIKCGMIIISSENSLSPIPNILDLTKRPNASWKWTREEKLGASHTHQTALYVQCVIECMTKKETLQCRQSVLFNLHCTSIHPRQHAKLEQVVFICQLLKALLHRTADISTALEAALLLFRITFAPWSPFSVHVRKLPLVTGNTLRA